MSAVEVAVYPTPGIRVSTEQKPASRVNVLEELSNYIITSKYARYREDLKRRETWEEAVSRVEDMHLKHYAHLGTDVEREIRWAFDFVRDKRVVPSMRSLQFGGKAVEAHNARIYNCAVRHLDSVRGFAEIFYLLLCGCGVGVGLTNRHLSKLPELVAETYKSGEPLVYSIQDTIEGWGDALEILIKSFVKGNEFSSKEIVFDYSLIRPKGAKLKTGGGKAPGPMPLKRTLDDIRHLLSELVRHGESHIRTIHAYDIIMFAADAVLSGGVRRSAVSIVFDKDDEEMLHAKTGDWFVENPQRGRSNNSVLLLRDKVTQEDFDYIIKRTKQWGEPGFVFANHPDTLFNPCFEVSFIPITEEGETGIQFCNLSSINGSRIESVKDFMECARAATIIGTLQAGYTNFPYLSKEAKELTESEALLGVSIIAMMEKPEILLDPIWQKEAAKVVVNTNRDFAAKLGIRQAARATVVKPDGTCALALGTMSSGIHPAHAPKMFRRVQANKNDIVYQFFKMHNPHLCEDSIFSRNGTDDVITFPVTVPKGAMVKADLDAIKHLEIIKSTQQNWVLSGTTEANTRDVAHNVSCTVQVREDEWSKVAKYLYENREFFAAVSLLAATGDKDYAQSPMEAVVTAADESKFFFDEQAFEPVDYTLLPELDDFTDLQGEIACSGGKCEI